MINPAAAELLSEHGLGFLSNRRSLPTGWHRFVHFPLQFAEQSGHIAADHLVQKLKRFGRGPAIPSISLTMSIRTLPLPSEIALVQKDKPSRAEPSSRGRNHMQRFVVGFDVFGIDDLVEQFRQVQSTTAANQNAGNVTKRLPGTLRIFWGGKDKLDMRRGGSSSVFSKALESAFGSMWTSSIVLDV